MSGFAAEDEPTVEETESFIEQRGVLREEPKPDALKGVDELKSRLTGVFVGTVARTVLWLTALVGAVVKAARDRRGRLVIVGVLVVFGAGIVLAAVGGKVLSTIVHIHELTTKNHETHD